MGEQVENRPASDGEPWPSRCSSPALALQETLKDTGRLTNDREGAGRDLVFKANDRCDQENLIAQLKGGAHALRAAVDNLVSNWAYMVMTALAWNLKAWFALSVPEHPRHREAHRAQKRGLLRIKVWVRQPRFRRGDQAVRHEGAMVSGELPNDSRLSVMAPRQGE